MLTKDQDRNVYNGSPTFSPDGKWIAFSSDDEKSAALVVMAADGTGRRTVVAGGHSWYPRWSPDGRWLVYTAAASSGDTGNVDILAVPVTGDGKPLLLVGSPKRDLEGSWHPQGLR
jgi:TolB protein